MNWYEDKLTSDLAQNEGSFDSLQKWANSKLSTDAVEN